MATPNVTGVVALIRSEFPDWDYQQVIDHLYATARPAASMAGITTTGAIANAKRLWPVANRLHHLRHPVA